MIPYKNNSTATHLVLFIAILFILSCTKDKNLQSLSQAEQSSLSTGRGTKPNIILIMGDDIGKEIPTYNGGESYQTPNLDFMAAAGLQFPKFTAHPDGPPSRLAFMTGRYNFRNWVEFGELPASEKTFANLVHDAGYATCFTGKWQLDGGDSNIVNHGFDKYLAFMPFEPDNNNGHNQYYRRYKNPYLYSAGKYLTDEKVQGKYSEDMFYDFASNFIDSNLNKPFLIFYSFNLVQKPWVPTPDNPEFAAWDTSTDDDTKANKDYYPEMISYLDKNVGKLINKVQSSGLANNTVIIFTSDNATNNSISSIYKGESVNGTKGTTTFDGTNVPLLIYAPGIISLPGSIDTSLVDMTDFFPTIADIAKTSLTAWKPLDGVTFYDNIIGTPLKQRSYDYCYWPQYFRTEPPFSYVFDYNYKLYDSLSGGNFYRINIDRNEEHPIPNKQLTNDEKKIKNKFQRILNQSHP